MNKIITILSSTPATIITTIIAIVVLLVVFKDLIIIYVKDKFDLYDENDIVKFVKETKTLRRISSVQTIKDNLFMFKLKQKENARK